MKRILTLSFLLIFVMAACQQEKKHHEKAEHKLVFVAATPDSLRTPESVLYYPSGNFLFVSNINGKPLDKDGNGFISKIDLNGNIIDLRWVKGLNAPKGMGVADHKLYVTDIDRLVIIDIDSAHIIQTIPVQGAKFLNDIAIDKNGNVYISDSQNNLIYRFNGDTVEVFANELKGANGLYFLNDAVLYVGCADRLAAVNINSGQVATVMKVNTVMIDGLKKVCPKENEFITTDWQGKIFLINTDENETELLMDFPDKNKNAADVEFIMDKHLLYIPTFFNNTVEIYKLTASDKDKD